MSLCYKCAKFMYTCDVGSCKNCGGFTSSGGFKLCGKCAVVKNECAACAGPLDAKKPPVSPDTKLRFIVSVDTDKYTGKLDYNDRPAVKAACTAAFVSWKKDVEAALVAAQLQADDVVFRNDLINIGIAIVECTEATAAVLRAMDSVLALSEES